MWKTSPIRTPRLRSAALRRLLALVLLLSLAVTWFGPAAPSVGAETAPRVVTSQAGYVFSDSLTFEARLEGAASVSEVILFFGRVSSPLVRRVYPELSGAATLRVRHVETLEPGQYAPGTEFHFWWQVHQDDGSVFDTPAQRFEYTDSRFDWQRLAGDRLDLCYYGRQRQRAEELLGAAEEALDRLEEETGVSVDARVRVYAYNSSRDMAGALSRRSEVYDDRVLTLGVAVDEYTLLLLGTHRDAEMVVAHELSHIVVGIATANPFVPLPRWLDEGLAMHAEGELPTANRRALQDAVKRDALISLRSMTSYSGRAEQVDLFYGAAYSVVEFLLEEYGRDSLRQLLEVFSEGVRQNEALRRVYGFGLDELEDQWRRSLGLAPRERADSSSFDHAGPA